jgi:hypothetical protein
MNDSALKAVVRRLRTRRIDHHLNLDRFCLARLRGYEGNPLASIVLALQNRFPRPIRHREKRLLGRVLRVKPSGIRYFGAQQRHAPRILLMDEPSSKALPTFGR